MNSDHLSSHSPQWVHAQQWAFIADLQSECWTNTPAWVKNPLTQDVDGYFLGGDIGHIDDTDILYYRWINILQLLRAQTDAPIFYVLGNHEYYGSSNAYRVKYLAQDICNKVGITLLDKNTVNWGYWSISGCTLWSHGNDTDTKYHCQQLKINIEQYQARYQTDLEWLTGQTLDRTIVMTHYPPTCEIIPQTLDRSRQGMYCSSIWPHKICPPLWFCGHVHHNIKIKNGEKELISHSWGRPGEIKNVNGPCYGTIKSKSNSIQS